MSGKKPIAVSGMANSACSVATRYGAVHRDADAAAHADAVDQRDIGLGIGRDHQVQRVFLARRMPRARRCSPSSSHLAHRADVAAGAEGAVAGALDHHGVHMRIVAPLRERGGAGADHREIERVQCLRAVEHGCVPRARRVGAITVCSILHVRRSASAFNAPLTGSPCVAHAAVADCSVRRNAGTRSRYMMHARAHADRPRRSALLAASVHAGLGARSDGRARARPHCTRRWQDGVHRPVHRGDRHPGAVRKSGRAASTRCAPSRRRPITPGTSCMVDGDELADRLRCGPVREARLVADRRQGPLPAAGGVSDCGVGRTGRQHRAGLGSRQVPRQSDLGGFLGRREVPGKRGLHTRRARQSGDRADRRRRGARRRLQGAVHLRRR